MEGFLPAVTLNESLRNFVVLRLSVMLMSDNSSSLYFRADKLKWQKTRGVLIQLEQILHPNG